MSGATGGRFRDALRQRDFRLLVAAYVVDALGSWAYSVVLAVYIFDRTGSTEWLAAAAASRWVTGLLVGSYAGVLADRYERTRVMLVSALASAAVMGIMAVVVGSDGPLWLLLVLSALSAVAASAYRPAAGALTPEVVGEKDLTAANGLAAFRPNGSPDQWTNATFRCQIYIHRSGAEQIEAKPGPSKAPRCGSTRDATTRGPAGRRRAASAGVP